MSCEGPRDEGCVDLAPVWERVRDAIHDAVRKVHGEESQALRQEIDATIDRARLLADGLQSEDTADEK